MLFVSPNFYLASIQLWRRAEVFRRKIFAVTIRGCHCRINSSSLQGDGQNHNNTCSQGQGISGKVELAAYLGPIAWSASNLPKGIKLSVDKSVSFDTKAYLVDRFPATTYSGDKSIFCKSHRNSESHKSRLRSWNWRCNRRGSNNPQSESQVTKAPCRNKGRVFSYGRLKFLRLVN